MQHLNSYPGEVDTEAILSRYGVTHGGLFSMVIYKIILSIMTDQIWGKYPGYIQSGYSDDFSTAGAGTHLKTYINHIKVLGPTCDIFLKPYKSKNL